MLGLINNFSISPTHKPARMNVTLKNISLPSLGCAIKALITGVFCLNVSSYALANQTINTDFPTSCVSQGGTLDNFNFITDFDNGTFGTANGQADQTPDINPYPNQVTGGVFDNFYDIDHGDYAYIANIHTERNRFQHPDVEDDTSGPITDPEFGATGRFFASDPNDNTPTLNFSITNVIPNENYELAFWAVNSELNGTPNVVNAVVDGIVSFSTGDLIAVPEALPWQRYAFVFNAGNRDLITLAMASTETGNGGRDFYIDNVTLKRCLTSAAQTGSIEGNVYIDSNGNNNFDMSAEGGVEFIDVQLWDTGGDNDDDNDVFISSVDSDSDGFYNFINLLPNSDYQLRVDTSDSDLASQLVIGTPSTIDVTVTGGGVTSGHDFGFDPTAAILQAAKVVSMHDPNNDGLFAIPGNEVVYTISVTNRGNGATDNDTIFIVDVLPDHVELFTGDFDGPGGLTNELVLYQETGAGLNYNFNTDVGFSRSSVKPANFSACNDAPSGTYDGSINFICFAPSGQMSAGTPDPEFSVSFRMRIE